MFYKNLFFLLSCSIISLLPCFCAAEIDKTKYITIDEITPGMDAVCLTVYKGVEIEKFSLKVVDVVRNLRPGKNAILVMGTDERFIHTGPVAGCSGSPIYINGRLAGALAFGWTYSKDPLYGVTPIEEMLKVGTDMPMTKTSSASAASAQDFSKPIDLKTAYNQIINFKNPESSAAGGITMLPCPIATTLPISSISGFAGIFESAGFMPVSAGASGKFPEYSDMQMKPGCILSLPLVYGDIELSAIGTVTEVAGDKIYGFGHSFLGEGAIDVPMATGYVHTVIANLVRSFKFGKTIDVKGALYADQSSAVVGTIGKKAVTIPMRITIDRFNDEKIRTYNCQVASHRSFTPLLAGTCLAGTARMVGALPADHTIRYKTRIGVSGYDTIYMENFSSALDLEECLSDSIGAINLILNNPYDRPAITSIDFEVEILPKASVSRIWNFEVSGTTVEPGRTITAQITLESYLSSNKTYKTQIKIPDDTPPGEYELIAMGASDYKQFITGIASYKYTPENMPDLIKVINDIANIKRNDLYLVMALPAGGTTLDKSELPQLPMTKTLLLKNDKRSTSSQPAPEWLSRIIPVDTIVLDARSFTITVEKK
ncbi:MAG: SpoIVB peptidase S55 domain-containing protein [Phycisphaerae bacterium]|jgi:hypothetical protein